MNRKLFSVAAVAAFATVVALPLRAETFAVDPSHSEVSFQIRHMVSQVRGRFNDFSGTVQLDAKNLAASSVDFHIKATSIDTNTPDRDKHLRSADFFDVEKFPEITFKSESIQAAGKDKYNVTGTLTMHGVSKKVTLPVTLGGEAKDPWGNTRAGFGIETTLDRKDYGIVWNKAIDNGGVMLGDDVKIAINLEAVKKSDKPAAKGK
ncbi:MAG TPA: YceI family protein [Thermoanaerobaculia bacterium]|jgi:polyisoprenoid-binding protein YceI|nr:YceI family protein [Thermoanaerobaculia bacterium]